MHSVFNYLCGMKIVVHSKYEAYRKFIELIPSGNYTVEKVFCNHRNVVELVACGEERFVIKRFKQPTWFNRFVYTFFRKTKAQRAFENAGLLLSKGIGTAEPVAWITEKHFGLFQTGWFVSQYLPYPALDAVLPTLSEEELALLSDNLVKFTRRMYQQSIINGDYNQGNILVRREADGYHFALVDINRLRQGKPSLNEEMNALVQLGVTGKDMGTVIPYYAEENHHDVEKSMFLFLWNKLRLDRRNKMKKKLKKFLHIDE